MNRCVFLYLFTFIFFSLNAAHPELKFTRYTTREGLSHNYILSICQDTMGFLWFGTKYGCSRFDGVEFKNYHYSNDRTGTINDGWVRGIVKDSKNNLWFATAGLGGALMRYDYETDKFIDVSNLITNKLNIDGKLFDIWKIFPDKNGCVWIENPDYGFICYNVQNDAVDVFNHTTHTFLVNPTVYDFSKNDVWFTTDYGLYIYNTEKKVFINFKHDPNNPKSLSSDKCSNIIRDSNGNVWITTFNGLNKMVCSDSGDVRFEHFKHNLQNSFSLSSNLLYDITEDRSGNLLIATVNGLCLMDKKANKIYRYFNSEIDDESVNSNLIRTIYKDEYDNIWMGTDAGVGKLQMKNFKSYSRSLYENSISHNKVQDFCELSNAEVWIATPKGIDVFNRKNETFNLLMGVTQNSRGLYGAPLALYPDKDKGIWIGTWNGGFSYFNHVSQKVTNYITKPEANEALSVFSFFTDSKNNLWISARGGVYVYNKKTGIYKKITHDEGEKHSLSSNYSFIVTEDPDSNIWIGTLNGLNKLIDFEKGLFKRYLNETGTIVRQIQHVSDNYMWIATNIGLYRFNKAMQQFKKFDMSDGLPSNSVLSILEDSLHNFWISTDGGLAKLEIQNDSIINITNYHKEDGINAGEFLERSNIKLKDGTMIFGGTEGFCMFHPSKIKTDTLPPKIVFTNLTVGNKNVDIGQEINGQVILEKSITLTKYIALNHKNNTFSVQFAGLQYNMPKHNQYSYKLFGYEKNYPDWYYTNAENRKAEFFNIPPGNYVLKVKAANSYGVWNNQSSELKITVLPPWWLTYWFISLMVILLVLIMVLAVRIRTYKLHKQKLKLAKIVEQRTVELKEMNIILNERKEELEAQAEELSDINSKLLTTNTELKIKTDEVENMAKQLHEADQLKLRFFANISHEFRTPLTLIMGPLEKFTNLKRPVDWNKTNIDSNLNLMYKNAKRLFRLINQVIDFRKIDQNEKRLNVSNNNIVEFTKEVIDAFLEQAGQKNISLKVESQYPTFEFWFDPDIMEKILYNLISNAIKYTPEGGNVSVQLSVNSYQSTVISDQLSDNNKLFILNYSPLAHENAALSSSLLIKVVDTGIGIKEENLDKIFNRFYRIENKENFAEGTGIGLAYAKELTELHKGTISVESEYGKGTAFILQFPKYEKANSEENVNKEASPIRLDYIRSMIEPKEDKTTTFINEKHVDEDIENNLLKKPNILIVEDNADLRNFIKNELLSDFNVNEAANGKEGLELSVKTAPDLIISDIMMPIMDGIELCKRIKFDENTSHIPLILLTAKGSDTDQIKGLETGADDYITKPFNINILKIKIRNILLARKRMQEKFNNSLDIKSSEITHSLIDEEFMQKAIATINKNMQNYEFDNDAFIDAMNCSKALVYRKIRSLTGQSVSEFIRSIRLKAAAKLFLEGNDNIAEVCYKAGFKHPNHFTTYFGKMFGKSPREFIKDSFKK